MTIWSSDENSEQGSALNECAVCEGKIAATSTWSNSNQDPGQCVTICAHGKEEKIQRQTFERKL